MQASVQKWGNSLALRIPKALAEQLDIALGSKVDIKVVGDVLQIEPVSSEKYTLDMLLGGVTEENLHSEVDTGLAQGKEEW